MENSLVGPLVDTSVMTNDESLLAGVELALNNNYCNNNDDDGDNDDNVLFGVLAQVRHAYVLPPATSAHGSQTMYTIEG